MLIRLTEHEIRVSGLCGVEETIDCIFNHRQRACGDDNSSGNWRANIEGKCGEMAAAKVLNRYWCGQTNTFRGRGDIGNLEVRTRSSLNYQLYVRPDDADDRYFLLVRGVCPDYDVVGYILGKDAKRNPDWLKPYGGYPPAYFVPDEELILLKGK